MARARLIGRDAHPAIFGALIDAAPAGDGALLVRGEPGFGKYHVYASQAQLRAALAGTAIG